MVSVSVSLIIDTIKGEYTPSERVVSMAATYGVTNIVGVEGFKLWIYAALVVIRLIDNFQLLLCRFSLNLYTNSAFVDKKGHQNSDNYKIFVNQKFCHLAIFHSICTQVF